MTRFVEFCFSFLILLFTLTCARTESLFPVSLPESGTVEVRADVEKWMPLDEERTADLNGIVKHLAVQLAWQTGQQQVRLLLDEELLLELDLAEEDSETKLWTSCLPDTVFQAENSGTLLEELFGLQTDGTDDAEIEELLTWAAFTEPVVRQLRTVFRETESFTDKKNQQNVRGYGKTTRRLSYLGDAQALLKQFLPEADLPLSGELYGLVTDDGTLHKAGFSGSAGEDGGWKVTAAWKTAEGKDSISIEAAKKPARAELDFSLTQTVSEMKVLEMSLNKKENSLKSQQTLTMNYRNTADSLAGSAEYRIGTKKTGILYEIDMDLRESEGSIHVRRTVGGVNPFAARIHLMYGSEAGKLPSPDGRLVRLADLSDSEKQEWRDRIRSAFMVRTARALLDLPENDLMFISRGLDEETWQRILKPAGIVDANEPLDVEMPDFESIGE